MFKFIYYDRCMVLGTITHHSNGFYKKQKIYHSFHKIRNFISENENIILHFHHWWICYTENHIATWIPFIQPYRKCVQCNFERILNMQTYVVLKMQPLIPYYSLFLGRKSLCVHVLLKIDRPDSSQNENNWFDSFVHTHKQYSIFFQ